MSIGCTGGKLVGAGGGGFILVNCPKNKIVNVENFLKGKNKQLINFDIDRYIVKSTEDIKDERYILFANYQFNV